MRPVPHKPNSNRMPASPLYEAVTQACLENFQQLHLHRHWFSLLCTVYTFNLYMFSPTSAHKDLSSFSRNHDLTWDSLGWPQSRAFSLLHVSSFCLPKPDCKFLERGDPKTDNTLYRQIDNSSNNNSSDICTKRLLLLLVIEKICLNMFKRLSIICSNICLFFPLPALCWSC